MNDQWYPIFSLNLQQLQQSNVQSWYDYRLRRYTEHLKGARNVQDSHIRHLAERNDDKMDIVYCKKEDLPQATPEIEKAQRCFAKIVTDRFPLMAGEHITDDFFTFLLKPFGVAKAHTALLFRTTSMAKQVFIIHSVKVELPAASNSAAVCPMLTMMSSKEWSDEVGDKLTTGGVGTKSARTSVNLRDGDYAKSAATKIANQLLEYMLKQLVSDAVGAFLGPIGEMGINFLFSELFPTGMDTFQQVYIAITKIVKQELAQEDINNINGALANIGSALQNEYTQRRKRLDLNKKTNREILMDLLQKYDSTFLSGPDGMLGLATQPQFRKAGLATYILGISLRIAIYQECATVDPAQMSDGKFFSPLESTYGKPQSGTVASTAMDAATYVSNAWKDIKADRAKAIYIEEFEKSKYDGTFGPDSMSTMVSCARIRDDIIGKTWDEQEVNSTKKQPYIIPDSMYQELDARRKDAIDQLTKEMGDPDTIISNFKKLFYNPLNMPVH